MKRARPHPHPKDELLNPHTLRLVRLVLEGTHEHSAEAASHLYRTRFSSSQLWDLLGRLQEGLTNKLWKTRTQAAECLQLIAAQLPQEDQLHFLETEEGADDIDYLSVRDLPISTILDKGKLLLSSSRKRFQDDLLEDLDRSASSKDTFVRDRIRLQRRILAKRLGLHQLDDKLNRSLLPDAITDNDLIEDQDSKPPAKKLKHSDDVEEQNVSLRALLVMQSERKNHRSHRDPQLLLSSELIYRMFDPDWHIRHGALLGICALLKAWKKTRPKSIGAWPRDILARCVCLLCLDRFGDFSGALIDTSTASGGVIAPTREIAGQTLSLLYSISSAEERQQTNESLASLAMAEPWEARHGAMVALKYIMTLSTVRGMDDSLPRDTMSIYQMARRAFSDSSDDVKGEACQILLQVSHNKIGIKDLCSIFCEVAIMIKRAGLVSTYVLDFVALLGKLTEAHLPRPHDSDDTFQNDVLDAFGLLQKLMDMSSSNSVKIVVLRTTTAMLRLWSQFEMTETEETVETLIELILSLFNKFLSVDSSLAELPKVLKDCWVVAIQTKRSLLSSAETKRLRLLLLDRYFFHEQLCLHRIHDPKIVPSTATRALIDVLKSEDDDDSVSTYISLMIHSPWTFQFESACYLFRACSQHGLQLPNSLQQTLLRTLEDIPYCMRMSSCGESRRKLMNVQFLQSFLETTHKSLQNKSNLARKDMDSILNPQTKRDVPSPVARELIRLRSSVAGALLSTNLPDKVTGIIRALMTALMNDLGSFAHEQSNCDFIVSAVRRFNEVGREKTSYKLVSKVCALASTNDCQVDDPAFLTATRLAPHILSFNPEFVKESILSNGALKGSGSLKLALAFVQGLDQRDENLTRLLETILPPLIALSFSPEPEFQPHLDLIWSSLCTKKARECLAKCLPPIVENLDVTVCASRRNASCRLLLNIVHYAGSSVCNFLRRLLPFCMRLMTDKEEGVSRRASTVFAILVQMAPLVESKTKQEEIQGLSSVSDSVVDHLILGRPLPPCAIPDAIVTSLESTGIHLRPYQAEGISWLRFLKAMGLSGALCDSMGLGKTIQALVCVAMSHQNGRVKSLIVCPASVVGHWIREAEKVFVPLKQRCCVFSTTSSLSDINQADVLVASYAVLRKQGKVMKEVVWEYCVLDEGHLLRNPRTATAKAARNLVSRSRIVLTGTPIQNSAEEVWALFDFLMPNFLGSHASFTSEFGRPILRGQRQTATAKSIYESNEKLKLLHQRILPFVLRRTKDAVLKDLPPKIITTVLAPLGDLQRRIYDHFCQMPGVQSKLHDLRLDFDGQGELSSEIGSNRGMLKTILFLRLLCTHPALLKRKENLAEVDYRISGKLVALVHLLGEAGIYKTRLVGADEDSSVLYSEEANVCSNEPTEELCQVDDSIVYCEEDGQKFKNRCLIFTQFTKTLDVLEEAVLKKQMPGVGYLRIDGSVDALQRAEIAERFNSDKTIAVLLLTTRVGSLGLNLTGANTVILLEPDFNPFADMQAMDRAHRLGQDDTVNVYRLISQSSVEERIMDIQQKKEAMSAAIVNTDNSSMYQMGTDRLLDIFTLRSSDADRPAEHVQDLDSLMDTFVEDYASLSTEKFSELLQ